MSSHLGWPEIALRLALTFLAGLLVGLDRREHGRPAGMRTTVLVCLSAAVAMIEANLLLINTPFPEGAAFSRFDVMRLPLGVLTGVGFIGAGTIIRRGGSVLGITTAATLWFVTIIGLCLGAGQYGLGLISVGLVLVVLWLLKRVESHIRQDRRADLTVTVEGDEPSEEEMRNSLRQAGLHVVACSMTFAEEARRRTYRWTVQWHGLPGDIPCPKIVSELARRPGVGKLRWRPENADSALTARQIST